MEKFVIKDRKIYKSGNSVMIALPPLFAEKLGWKPGELVDIEYKSTPVGHIVLSKGIEK